jgi:glycoside/pentoside/hexuronide:cation symporter, GPH family
MLSRTHLLRYSLLAGPLAMAALPIYVHVPKLYAGLGLSLSLLGGLLLLLRLGDAFIDPWLGRWSDRLPSRWLGLAIGAAALVIGMLALLNPLFTTQTHLLAWLAVSLILVYFGFSLCTITYGAWGAELSQEPSQRTTLTATREGIGLIGVLLAAVLPTVLADNASLGLARFAWVFAVLFCGALVIIKGVQDRSQLNQLAATSATPLKAVLSDRPYRALLWVFALNGIASAIPATLLLFFVGDVLQASQWEPVFLVAYFLAGALTMPLWVILANKVGKVKAWGFSMLLAIAVFIWAMGFASGDRIPFLIVCLASGMALGADLALPPALLADLLDRNKGTAGAYFGVWSFISKLTLALAAGLTLPAIGALGYRVGDPQSNTLALSLAYTLLPCLLKCAAICLLVPLQRQLNNNPSSST